MSTKAHQTPKAEVESKQAAPNSGAGYVDLSYYDNAMKLLGR